MRATEGLALYNREINESDYQFIYLSDEEIVEIKKLRRQHERERKKESEKDKKYEQMFFW